MNKAGNLKTIILIVYLIIISGIILWLTYPLVLKPQGLSQTKIPSVDVSGITEASGWFEKLGKQEGQQPTEPNLNNYVFGQQDPI